MSLRLFSADIFDYYNSIGASQSDVELDIAMLEQALNKIGIRVEDRPSHIASLTVDETLLGQYIQDALPGQTLEARQHDIDVPHVDLPASLRAGATVSRVVRCHFRHDQR
ncbi:hypothetical protein [uncultured Propionivibrio sp.]|uniref:hypothetical protein n=1 Tax=uncultured Propionivibrio sp. TaxID=426737 RepID=UPI0029C0EB30|nr:hypothetical protein [uncultured Propionivibrio sp.]